MEKYEFIDGLLLGLVLGSVITSIIVILTL
jgi:hypothetical protein